MGVYKRFILRSKSVYSSIFSSLWNSDDYISFILDFGGKEWRDDSKIQQDVEHIEFFWVYFNCGVADSQIGSYFRVLLLSDVHFHSLFRATTD